MALVVDPLTITTSNSLAGVLLPVVTTLSCVGLEVSFSRGRNAPTKGHSNGSIEWEVETVMWPFSATYVTE